MLLDGIIAGIIGHLAQWGRTLHKTLGFVFANPKDSPCRSFLTLALLLTNPKDSPCLSYLTLALLLSPNNASPRASFFFVFPFN